MSICTKFDLCLELDFVRLLRSPSGCVVSLSAGPGRRHAFALPLSLTLVGVLSLAGRLDAAAHDSEDPGEAPISPDYYRGTLFIRNCPPPRAALGPQA